MGDLVGKYGLERLMDDDLRGVNGGRKVEVDAAGRDQRLVEEVPSRSGGAVHTSLDADLPGDGPGGAWKPGGAVIALAPRTGEVLAFFSGPRSTRTCSRADPEGRMAGAEHRSAQADAEQGSAGDVRPGLNESSRSSRCSLEEKMQEREKIVLCPGRTVSERVFRCWRGRGTVRSTCYRAIVQSCDVTSTRSG